MTAVRMLSNASLDWARSNPPVRAVPLVKCDKEVIGRRQLPYLLNLCNRRIGKTDCPEGSFTFGGIAENGKKGDLQAVGTLGSPWVSIARSII